MSRLTYDDSAYVVEDRCLKRRRKSKQTAGAFFALTRKKQDGLWMKSGAEFPGPPSGIADRPVSLVFQSSPHDLNDHDLQHQNSPSTIATDSLSLHRSLIPGDRISMQHLPLRPINQAIARHNSTLLTATSASRSRSWSIAHFLLDSSPPRALYSTSPSVVSLRFRSNFSGICSIAPFS
ncbi:hypothetical protein EV356DRAFT_380335 [Viridothelium virens]|uniref:Uncharacterized protein n=1 Tax=Viridothelium virens TaxID=1048519 RepID=A0A6A6HHK3_VIRVR|nr:hypothetical protein EV356DRAFT_380335 [Viridothelium virens]